MGHQIRIRDFDLGPEQRVIDPALRFVDIEVSWHDVEIADESYRYLELKQLVRVGMKSLKPV